MTSRNCDAVVPTRFCNTHMVQDDLVLLPDLSLLSLAMSVLIPPAGGRGELDEILQSLSTYLTSDRSGTDPTCEPPQRDLQLTSQLKHSEIYQFRRTILANQLFQLREAEHQHLHTLQSIS